MGVLHKGNKKPPGGPNNRRTPPKRSRVSSHNNKPEESDDDSVELMWDEIDKQIDEVSDGFAEMRYHISIAEGRLEVFDGHLISGITQQINTMERKLELIRTTLHQLRQAQCSDMDEL